MSMRALQTPRFERRTQLGPHEYRKNFRQIDNDVLAALTSPEADAVTPLMSKIYLCLVQAPVQYREREGVLRFEGQVRGDKHVTAWDALCELVRVASATARKALRWMHEQGIIGYFSGKNGVGLRVFLNRASSSIGTRPAGQKILEFPRASSGAARTSTDEAGFMDSYAVLEVLEPDVNPRAPKSGAEPQPLVKNQPDPAPVCSTRFARNTDSGESAVTHAARRPDATVEQLVSRLKRELEPTLQSAARRAAAQEHERTREWLESRGLPKAARVAQREAFNLLRRYGVIKGPGVSAPACSGAGQNESSPGGPRPLSGEEVEELAQACAAMLVVQGQSIEQTLSGMYAGAGGFVLPDDAALVMERAEALLAASVDG